MKSTIFRKVLKEEFIEVNKSVPKTIQYLREIAGGARHKVDNEEIFIFVECSKKGKISVESSFGHSRDIRCLYLFYVYGKVIFKDNKTYVKITSVYKKMDIWLRALVLLFIIPITLILKLCIDGILFIPAIIAASVVFIILTIDTIKTTSIRKKYGLEIVKLMEDEIKRRVKKIERWED